MHVRQHLGYERYDNPAAALINALCKGALEQLLNHLANAQTSEEGREGKKLVRHGDGMSQLDCFLKFPLTALVAIASMSSPNKKPITHEESARYHTVLGLFHRHCHHILRVHQPHDFVRRTIRHGLWTR
jgi:hypothetical protein